MTISELRELVGRQPEQSLRIWCVSMEDVYETAFGDGKFLYLARAFQEQDSAKRCVQWVEEKSSEPGKTGYSAEAHEVLLALNQDGSVGLKQPKGVQPHMWGEQGICDMFGGIDSSWKEIVEHSLGRGAVAPDFGI